MRTADQLRTDVRAIWQAGVDAVRSDKLVQDYVHVDGHWLCIDDEQLPLSEIGRIVVLGAGKAGAGMAAGLEQALGPRVVREKQVTGWLNVPTDCVRSLSAVHLHAARPAGINEPTAEGVEGSERILEIAASLRPNDVCFFLISGGGSALLPAPAVGISLSDKQEITRLLSAAGANIQELNTVRKQLSRIKGGQLALAAAKARLFGLIISDVLGDPLDLIASGPTVPDSSTPEEALAILERFQTTAAGIAPAAIEYLRTKVCSKQKFAPEFPPITNLIIGNNAVAVDAAGIEAERRGYSHAMQSATTLEGFAEEIGRHHVQLAQQMRLEPGPDCLITGGEPVVQLAPAAIRGRGGRNQQLVLTAFETLGDTNCEGIAFLSGGTDGEDGPTDAAGAFIDAEIARQAEARQLSAADYLRRNDAYHFFEQIGGLLKTGPTDTNVCDLRVIVVDRVQDQRKM